MIMSSTSMLGDDDDDVTYWLMKKLFDVWHTLLHKTNPIIAQIGLLWGF
jgi:hypothetical protein